MLSDQLSQNLKVLGGGLTRIILYSNRVVVVIIDADKKATDLEKDEPVVNTVTKSFVKLICRRAPVQTDCAICIKSYYALLFAIKFTKTDLLI